MKGLCTKIYQILAKNIDFGKQKQKSEGKNAR